MWPPAPVQGLSPNTTPLPARSRQRRTRSSQGRGFLAAFRGRSFAPRVPSPGRPAQETQRKPGTRPARPRGPPPRPSAAGSWLAGTPCPWVGKAELLQRGVPGCSELSPPLRALAAAPALHQCGSRVARILQPPLRLPGRREGGLRPSALVEGATC